jgi:hypothetical protein
MPQVVFGGMPVWLLEAYLAELGGSQAGDGGAVAGDGWRATLVQAPSGGGGIAIARVTVTIEGARAPEAMAALPNKALRGGG